jgi:tetratricopeptide (TPR) repeat protein
MQPGSVVLASLAVAAVAAAATTLLLRSAPMHEPAPAGPTEELAALRREVEALRQAAAAPPPAAEVVRAAVVLPDDEQLGAALASYLQRHGVPGAGGATSRPVLDVAAAFEELRTANPWTEKAPWKRVQEAGKWDEVIGRFEQRAKERPNDPDAQVELAMAYLARSEHEPEKWQLGIEADKCFDKALGLDPEHWGARFTKAVCYTFWPDFLGKKKEALRHFETLLEQQEARPSKPEYAQTYLFLGNMYEQRGDSAKAREVWTRGQRLFPNDADLQAKK